MPTLSYTKSKKARAVAIVRGGSDDGKLLWCDTDAKTPSDLSNEITLDNDAKQDFLKWSILPLSESAELFLTSISDYVELPEIADGYWMLVDRNPGTQKYTNVSFCIYDTAEEVAYMITMDS